MCASIEASRLGQLRFRLAIAARVSLSSVGGAPPSNAASSGDDAGGREAGASGAGRREASAGGGRRAGRGSGQRGSSARGLMYNPEYFAQADGPKGALGRVPPRAPRPAPGGGPAESATQRARVRIGARVVIVRKEDQRTGARTEGVVGRLLTSAPFRPRWAFGIRIY
jgi:uncharacterized repeat protein (TIGR03833 family)